MSAAILGLSLAELARAIALGDITSRAATEAVLAALDGRGRELVAVARLWPERAMAAAAAADARRRAGAPLPPLHGVPLAHKDMYYRAGELAELGSSIFKGFRPQVTASALERLDRAGALDVGRLNMVEFALGTTGHNRHTGTPRNAWDPARVTGGSTSGGATAVAARLIAATLGSDTGGSIRIPASFNGIVGIKPTYGRVSRAGAMPLSVSLDHVGPLCRTAEDCALILEAIAGHDPRDASTSRRTVPRYTEALSKGARGLRIGFAASAPGVEVDEDIAQRFEEAKRAMAAAGAVVTEIALPSFDAMNAIRRVVLMAECAALHRELVRTRRADYNPETLARMEPGFAAAATDYLTAQSARPVMLRHFVAEVFAAVDVVALPCCPVGVPTIADTDTGGDARFVAIANRIGALIGPMNYLGLPALSTPMGLDGSGMPTGLQLVGRPFAEATILRAAHGFDEVTGFTRRAPPMAPG